MKFEKRNYFESILLRLPVDLPEVIHIDMFSFPELMAS